MRPDAGDSFDAQWPSLPTGITMTVWQGRGSHRACQANGGGYPHGLAGEMIPLPARVFAVADTLDAMTSDRPYRRAGTFADALTEIERHAGTRFHPWVVATLRSLIREFEVWRREGVMVAESGIDGRVAASTRRLCPNSDRRGEPVARVEREEAGHRTQLEPTAR